MLFNGYQLTVTNVQDFIPTIIVDIAPQYDELEFLGDFIQKRVLPALGEKH